MSTVDVIKVTNTLSNNNKTMGSVSTNVDNHINVPQHDYIILEKSETEPVVPGTLLWKALLAEFVGTFALVFIGAGAAALTLQQGGSLIGTAFAFGLVLMTMIYVMGSYSGANFNPAVSFGLALSGRMNWGVMLLYWLIQLIAGIAAAALILYFFGEASGVGATVGSLTNTDPWKAIFAEAVATFFLVLTVLFVTRKPVLSLVAGIAIGLALTFGIIAIGPLTGGSLNPARSLGPAIFSGNIGSYWIYIIGPLLGGLIAAITYKLFVYDWNCCTLRDECGNIIRDECGNAIKECKRPTFDNCGKPISDCGKTSYETYYKS